MTGNMAQSGAVVLNSGAMTPVPPAQPTPAQRRVLDCIAELEAERRPVNTMLIAEKLSISRQSVRKHLLKLAEQGLVVYEAQERQQAGVRLQGREDKI